MNKSNAQFLDFNIFKPSVSVGAEQVFFDGYDSLSMGVSNYQVSTLIPIRRKFDVDVNFSDVLKSKGLKSAFRKMLNPKFHQTFARIGAGYRTYESKVFNQPVNVYNFSAGISGIKLQMKQLRFKFMFYSLNVRFQEQLGKYNTFSPSVSGVLGSAKIFDYRTALFYGVFANYFGKRFIPIPVVALYYKLDKSSTFLFAFPYQIQYSLKASKQLTQSFTVSLNAFSNGMYNDSILPSFNSDRLNFFQSSTRISSQTRVKLAKKTFFYLEAGWQDRNRVQYFDSYESLQTYKFKGNLFVKAKLTMVLGKSLFNSSAFNVDL